MTELLLVQTEGKTVYVGPVTDFKEESLPQSEERSPLYFLTCIRKSAGEVSFGQCREYRERITERITRGIYNQRDTFSQFFLDEAVLNALQQLAEEKK